MNNIYCTLFNVNYLDKGLVLYESLKQVCGEFILYVLAMDEKCYEILADLSKPKLIPIRLTDFETKELLDAKSNRSFGEYCWTCSSSLIKYVLKYYNQPICTYIDADMYFYEDPEILIKEMKAKGADVLVVGHHFNSFEREEREKISGKYCVEFNTFLKTPKSQKLLDIWVGQCLDSCSSTTGEGSLGDQMYLTNWCTDYPFVHETENMGAGVAPWNIQQYKLKAYNNGHYHLKHKKKDCELIFYHFENIEYLDESTVNINVYESWGIDDKLVRNLYVDYLQKIKETKKMLRNDYGVNVLLKRHPAHNYEIPGFFSRVKSVLGRIGDLHYLKHYVMSSVPKVIYGKRDIVKLR